MEAHVLAPLCSEADGSTQKRGNRRPSIARVVVYAAILATTLFALLPGSALATEEVPVPVYFPDPALQAAFVSTYGHVPTDQELRTLRWLNFPNMNITSLAGIDTYCPNLIGVILANNHISDISPLAPVAGNLVYAGLENNELTDISVLAPMHSYMVLHQLSVPGNYLDLTSGSSAMNVINTVASNGVNVSYTPQRNLTINATAGPHGSITPSGAVAVQPGSDANFTITPEAGYRIADVLVDGESVGAVSSYTFTHVVAQGHTISATFEEN